MEKESETNVELNFSLERRSQKIKIYQSLPPEFLQKIHSDDVLDLAGGAQDAIARHKAAMRLTNPDLDPKPKPALDQHSVHTSELSSALTDLVYWRRLQESGVCFGLVLFLLIWLSVSSIVTVLTYISLTLLAITISFRIYRGVIHAVQKSDDGHPFRKYLQQDMVVSSEDVNKYRETALLHINIVLKELLHIFLVEDVVYSLKFAVLLWICTYIGALFNGLTVMIIAHITVFTWPVIYQKHQTKIDRFYEVVIIQIKDLMKMSLAKIHSLKPKTNKKHE